MAGRVIKIEIEIPEVPVRIRTKKSAAKKIAKKAAPKKAKKAAAKKPAKKSAAKKVKKAAKKKPRK